MKKLIKILTDPISNRIIQQIRKNHKMTVSEIIAVLPDIPRATVYRRIERMTDAGVIEIVETHKVRGQAEHTYSIKNIYVTTENSGKNGMEIMTVAFVQMFNLCSEYFKSENADVERDKLFIMNYAISLSDHDFSEMLHGILSVVDRYQSKNVPKDAKTRNLYLMSLPTGGDNYES